jgi:hypothetical protein
LERQSLVVGELPEKVSLRVTRSRFVLFVPALAVGLLAAYLMGPIVERLLFAGNLQHWLSDSTTGMVGGWFLLFLPLSVILTLYLMGISTGFAEATLLESLSLAVRSAAFLIPSGWGAQEAALIGLAALTGLSGESALALGLVKRAREFAIGLPGLAAWAIAEHCRPLRLPG